ncbi:MAG: hypothetical protein EXR67_00885 [Dehalococcoidia bacterium]|nr:hypothetical protein [Dehalococcoidia bacterium]
MFDNKMKFLITAAIGVTANLTFFIWAGIRIFQTHRELRPWLGLSVFGLCGIISTFLGVAVLYWFTNLENSANKELWTFLAFVPALHPLFVILSEAGAESKDPYPDLRSDAQ